MKRRTSQDRAPPRHRNQHVSTLRTFFHRPKPVSSNHHSLDLSAEDIQGNGVVTQMWSSVCHLYGASTVAFGAVPQLLAMLTVGSVAL